MHPDAQSLAEQLAAMDPEPATPRDTHEHLVQSLVEQFAAGQSETLYSLHTAGATLRRQATALEQAVAQLPEDLDPSLRERFAELSDAIGVSVHQAVKEAANALATQLAQWQEHLGEATRGHAEALDTGRTALEAASRLVTAQTEEAVEQIEQASSSATTAIEACLNAGLAELIEASEASRGGHADVIDAGRTSLETAGRLLTAQTEEAVEQIEQASSSAVTAIEAALGTGLADLHQASAASQEQILAAGQTFGADATASASAVTAVGENVIERLLAVLDARDKADKALEDRLNARIDRLTTRTEKTVNRLIGMLADETDLLRQQAQSERASTAEQLTALVDRLLSAPRGKLKDLRTEAQKETT